MTVVFRGSNLSNFSNLQSSNPQPHQTGNISCPRCQAIDQVQKVSAIHSAGISDLKASGKAQGFSGLNTVSLGVNLEGRNQTYLSQKFAPPKKPMRLSTAIVALLFCAFIFTAFLGGILANTPLKYSLTTIVGFLSLALIISIVYCILDILVLPSRNYKKRLNYWQRACFIWNEIFYCNRCNVVYNPAQPQVTASIENISTLY